MASLTAPGPYPVRFLRAALSSRFYPLCSGSSGKSLPPWLRGNCTCGSYDCRSRTCMAPPPLVDARMPTGQSARWPPLISCDCLILKSDRLRFSRSWAVGSSHTAALRLVGMILPSELLDSLPPSRCLKDSMEGEMSAECLEWLTA